MASRSPWLELRELIGTIRGRLPQRAQVLDRATVYRGDEDYIRLFRAVESEEFGSEEELVQAVFSKAIDNPYRVLRTKLKSLALNSLFVLDLKSAKFSDYAVAKHTAARQAFQVRVLCMLGARRSARAVAREALALTRAYEFWDDQLLLLMFLRSDALQSGDLKSHQPLAAELFQTIRAIELEERSRALYGEGLLPFVKSISAKPHLAPKLEESWKQAAQWANEIDSYQIRLTEFRLKELCAEVSLNNELGLDAARSALAYIRSRPAFANLARETEFITKQISCLVNLDRAAEAVDVIVRENSALLSRDLPASYTWQEHYLYALFHARRIDDADAFYREATSHAAYALVPEHVRERWSVYGLYVDLAMGRQSHLGTVQELLEIASSYSKDKAGIQISIFLLYIVLSLRSGDRKEAARCLKAIRHYQSRYLSGDQASEERTFMRLLDIAITGDDSDTSREAVVSLRGILSQADPRRWVAPQVLPYGLVWDLLTADALEYLLAPVVSLENTESMASVEFA